jgi:hypothetical protein
MTLGNEKFTQARDHMKIVRSHYRDNRYCIFGISCGD